MLPISQVQKLEAERKEFVRVLSSACFSLAHPTMMTSLSLKISILSHCAFLLPVFLFVVQGKEMTQGVLTTQMKYWKVFASGCSGLVEVFKNLCLTYYKCNVPTVVAFTQFAEAGGWIIDAVYSLTRYLFVLPVWRSVGLSNLSPSISYAGVARAAWLARSWLSALSYTDSSGKSPSLLQQLPVSSVILQHVVSTAT